MYIRTALPLFPPANDGSSAHEALPLARVRVGGADLQERLPRVRVGRALGAAHDAVRGGGGGLRAGGLAQAGQA